MKRVTIKKYKVPQRYVPTNLSRKDKERQKGFIDKSRREYKKGKYYLRPKVKSFKSKHSSHVNTAREMYGVETMKPNKALAKKTGCSIKSLEKIVNKGRGAYYSSGSRPNQTPDSWGYARLASAITGGPASKIDYDILESGCNNQSKALKLAK
jgi:hypothetical protein